MARHWLLRTAHDAAVPPTAHLELDVDDLRRVGEDCLVFLRDQVTATGQFRDRLVGESVHDQYATSFAVLADLERRRLGAESIFPDRVYRHLRLWLRVPYVFARSRSFHQEFNLLAREIALADFADIHDSPFKVKAGFDVSGHQATNWLAMSAVIHGARGEAEEAAHLVQRVLDRQDEDGHFPDEPGAGSDQYHAYTLWLLADGQRRSWLDVPSSAIRAGVAYLDDVLQATAVAGDRGRGQRQLFGQASAVAALSCVLGSAARSRPAWRDGVAALARSAAAAIQSGRDGEKPTAGWYDYNRLPTYVAFCASACYRAANALAGEPMTTVIPAVEHPPSTIVRVANDTSTKYPSAAPMAPVFVAGDRERPLMASPGGPFGSPYGRRWSHPSQQVNHVGWVSDSTRGFTSLLARRPPATPLAAQGGSLRFELRDEGWKFCRDFTLEAGALHIRDAVRPPPAAANLYWAVPILTGGRSVIAWDRRRVELSDGNWLTLHGGRWLAANHGSAGAGAFTSLIAEVPPDREPVVEIEVSFT